MDKREFLKTSSVLMAGGLLSRLMSGDQQPRTRTNWAGNYTYSAQHLQVPESLEEVRDIVKRSTRVKALGARHSFNGIADSTVNQISLEHLNQIAIDEKSQAVTVAAGVRYGQLCPYLDSHGYALHNLASLPHITVAGACATGTHGSGNKNGNLSTAVSGLEMVTANGDVLVLSRGRDGNKFCGAVVALGGLGVVTKITLDVQPAFTMSQVVYENLSLTRLENHLDEIFGSGYSVSLFTDWQQHRATEVWIKRRSESGQASEWGAEFFGAKRAKRKLHPIADHPAESCTEQLGIPGPWYERMPHFRMNFTPSSGNELQTEYFVPRDKGYEAILAVEKYKDQISPHLFISELRTIAADDLWISPCYHRPSLAIHFTWKPEWSQVKELLPVLENSLAPFNARPHWAKLFTISPARLKELHERLPDFQVLVKEYDPQGKFRNAFLDTNIFSD